MVTVVEVWGPISINCFVCKEFGDRELTLDSRRSFQEGQCIGHEIFERRGRGIEDQISHKLVLSLCLLSRTSATPNHQFLEINF